MQIYIFMLLYVHIYIYIDIYMYIYLFVHFIKHYLTLIYIYIFIFIYLCIHIKSDWLQSRKQCQGPAAAFCFPGGLGRCAHGVGTPNQLYRQPLVNIQKSLENHCKWILVVGSHQLFLVSIFNIIHDLKPHIIPSSGDFSHSNKGNLRCSSIDVRHPCTYSSDAP